MTENDPLVNPNSNKLLESGVEEAIQQGLFDFFPGIVYVYDAPQKKLRYVNRKISEVLGYSHDDLKDWNHDLNKLIFQEDVESVQKELEKYDELKDEESHSYNCRLNRKLGDWMHFQVTGKVIRRDDKGKPASVLFIAQDIGDHIKATQELKSINILIKEKEELMENYKEQVDVKEEFLECGSWKLILSDKSISWSDGMYRLFGYDPAKDKDALVVNEELYRKHMTEHAFEKALRFTEDTVKKDNGREHEYEITTKDGEKRRIESFAKINRDRSGNAINILGTAHNITRSKKFEYELEQNINKLKTSVVDLEEFTYMASHDIQEPLRKIATFSARMKTKFADDLNDEAKNYLDRILTTSKSAHLLIDGLMSFLQLDHQHQLFKKTDLNILMDEVKVELELRMEESEATIIVKKLPILEVIPLQIKQLLVNLTLNAFKFRKRETLLVIEIESRKLTALEIEKHHLNAATDFYEILIKDNGIGFTEGATDKMFQMFQRFHNKSDYPGAGIGLAICKKIIDKHNGLISASSIPGQGATFSIILPSKQFLENAQR